MTTPSVYPPTPGGDQAFGSAATPISSPSSIDEVTFGITAFERPALLRQLLESIFRFYPTAKVVVANNGRPLTEMPDRVRVVDLPFDSGLSASRNALIDACETEFLLILEDDFRFLPETDIAAMLAVMDDDPWIGVVGGCVLSQNQRMTAYALDIEVCRGVMRVREATHRVHITDGGLPYRLCDMVWNFALFRRDMLREHRWIDALKVGEHCPYFYEVKLAGRWRVAYTSASKLHHVPHVRDAEYLEHRHRAEELMSAYLGVRGIERYERVLPYHFEDETGGMPPVVILAVGHSGTTVTTRALQRLGWNLGDADCEYAEHRLCRRINQFIEKSGRVPRRVMARMLSQLPSPWVLKDPRFVQTLHHWLPAFELVDPKPVLLCLRRDREAMHQSYERRGAAGDVRHRVDWHLRQRDWQYSRWPYGRMSLSLENLAAAAATFDPQRQPGRGESVLQWFSELAAHEGRHC